MQPDFRLGNVPGQEFVKSEWMIAKRFFNASGS